MESSLPIAGVLPLVPERAGLMMSRGKGRHIERIASFFVLLFVREGVLHIEEEGQHFAVEAGQTLLLWPGRLHRGTRDYDSNLQFFWLHFTLPEYEAAQEHAEAALNVPQYTRLNRPDFVNELFRRYLDDQDSGHLESLGAALYSWMILMEVADTRPPIDMRTAAALAGKAYSYIQTHFHQKISASDVADAVGYNAQYLGRVYQQTYRISLAGAIRRARISHAKSLLLETTFNIGEIGRLSGFEDAAYFQRVFKQVEGMTPLRFRRLHARMAINNQ